MLIQVIFNWRVSVTVNTEIVTHIYMLLATCILYLKVI